jgi:hypothetical protein
MRRVDAMNTEDSSPNLRRRSRRKIIIQETHSSGEDEEEEIPRSRRYHGRRFAPNKSYSFRSLSNGDAGPRRSSRQRTVR